MDSEDAKYSNLIRLLKANGLDPAMRGSGRKLAEMLGITKQYASQLIGGKCPIGDNVIQRLCAVWEIDEGEFFQPDKGGVQMAEEDWQMKILFEQLSNRINDQQKHVDNLAKLVTRLTDAVETNSANTKNETEKIWKVTNDDRVQTRADITMLTDAVVRIKGKMSVAANLKDITKLGELEAVSG